MALKDKARGQRIAALRKRTPGLTQQKVADDLKMGYRTIQTWESGAVVPEWENVKKLAKYYKVRPESILGEMPPMEPSQLDRIEAMLNEILVRMDAADIKPLTPAQTARKIAARAAEQSAQAPRGRSGTGQRSKAV